MFQRAVSLALGDPVEQMPLSMDSFSPRREEKKLGRERSGMCPLLSLTSFDVSYNTLKDYNDFKIIAPLLYLIGLIQILITKVKMAQSSSTIKLNKMKNKMNKTLVTASLKHSFL